MSSDKSTPVLTVTTILETAANVAGTVAGAHPAVALGVAFAKALSELIAAGHREVTLQIPETITDEMINQLRTLGGMNKTSDQYLEEARRENP